VTSDRAVALVPAAQESSSQQDRYSPGLRVNETVFVSGQIGLDENGAALADPERQYVAVFEQVLEILALGGCGFEDVVEIVSFHSSFDEIEIFQVVMSRYVLGPVFPSWTAVGATLGVPGALVELKCTAIRSRGERRR
jgi:enamine deaminase RidA (YjgF/YER057c/UK114 family)